MGVTPDPAPWSPLEEMMLAVALRKAERKGRPLSQADREWLEEYDANFTVWV